MLQSQAEKPALFLIKKYTILSPQNRLFSLSSKEELTPGNLIILTKLNEEEKSSYSAQQCAKS